MNGLGSRCLQEFRLVVGYHTKGGSGLIRALLLADRILILNVYVHPLSGGESTLRHLNVLQLCLSIIRLRKVRHKIVTARLLAHGCYRIGCLLSLFPVLVIDMSTVVVILKQVSLSVGVSNILGLAKGAIRSLTSAVLHPQFSVVIVI